MVCPDIEWWSRVLDGEAQEEARLGREHLASCESCRQTALWLRDLERTVREHPRLQQQGVCPPEEVMGRFLEGALPAPLLQSLESHFQSCSDCFQILASGSSREPAVSRKGRRALRWSLRGAAAAAVLLAVALPAGVWWYGTPGPEPIPSEERVAVFPIRPGSYAPDQPMVLRENSGLRLELSPRTRLDCLTVDGPRLRFRLKGGELSASVRDGARKLEIEVPGGVVRDIGTEFRVRVWETRLPWEPESAPPVRITVVETSRGIAEIRGGHATVQTDSSRKGYLIEGRDLFVHHRTSAPRESLLLENLRSLRAALDRGDRKGGLQLWGLLLENASRSREWFVSQVETEERLSPEDRVWAVRLLEEIGESPER